MEFLKKLFAVLDTQMQRPPLYGWFHILFLVLTVVATVVLCLLYKKGVIKNVRRVVLVTSLIVIALEIYKLLMFGISYENELKYEFVWRVFPWQFCSTPMFIGLIAGLTKGKFHNWMCSFLATYAIFAGTVVMLYPSTVFEGTIGINIQTMICHGSMITLGVFLYYTDHVEAKPMTFVKALPTFATCLTIAVVLNEVFHKMGKDANLFYISRHLPGDLPIFKDIQAKVPFAVSLVLYLVVFSLVAFLILLIAMGIKAISRAIKNAKAKKTA